MQGASKSSEESEHKWKAIYLDWTWCRTDTSGKMKPLLEVSASNAALC